MNEALRLHRAAHDAPSHVSQEGCARRAAAIRYRFEFDGVQPLPRPDDVVREARVIVGTVELYGAQRWLVKSVDETTDPPVAVLRRVRS